MFDLNNVLTADDGKKYKLVEVVAQQSAPAPTPAPAPAPVVEPPPATIGSIPLSKADPRFAANAVWMKGSFARGILSNKKWDDSPSYGSGEPCFNWTGNGSDVLTIDKALIDCREGPRIAPGSTPTATLNITDSFINCVGKGTDHADGMQAYDPRGIGLVDVKRTCFRSYSDAEARAKYGSGFIGSCGFFWADAMAGEVRFTDVVFWGGGRGVAIYADAGTTRVSFKNVYFVPGPDGWTGFDFDIRATGGKLEIDAWDVYEATIVNGVLVPGKAIPKP